MNIPQGYKQTELGIIPEDWEVKPIGALGRIVGGGTPPTSVSQYWNGGIAWYTPAEIGDSKYLSYSIKTISELGLHASSARLLPPGTILLTTRASIGLSAILRQAGTTNQGFQSVIVYDSYDNEFVYYLLQQYIDVMYSLASGSTFLEISKNKLAFINVAFPVNRIEQHAIAETLSDIDGLIEALDKKIAKKRLIKQGAMQELLIGKKRLPGYTGEWIEKKVKDIFKVTRGYVLSTNKTVERPDGYYKYPVYSSQTQNNGIMGYYSEYLFDNAITWTTDGANAGEVNLRKGKFYCTNVCGVLINEEGYTNDCIAPIINMVAKSHVSYIGNPKLMNNVMAEIDIRIPSSLDEQRAIATILSDMDKEIAELEAKRDKYRLLKSGMMQKLLTGQIRLTKSQAKVVPLDPKVPAAREIPVDTFILAGHIVNRLWQTKGWGRTKLQKSLHLIGYYVQLNLGNEYIRNTAGPDDQLLMNYIDQKFKQYHHVNIVKERWLDGTVHYSYTPTPLVQELEMAYERYPRDIRERIDNLLDKLSTMSLAGAEILSTLYAVWNNRIIEGEPITDDLLLADFYAWSRHKADFAEKEVREVLDYMRKEGIIPTGWGKYIGKR